MNQGEAKACDTRSLSRDGQLDALCDQFEQQWKAGQHPQIEDLLNQAEPGDRNDLLRDLAALELGLRLEAGEDVDPDGYRQRFSGRESIIDAAIELVKLQRATGLPPSSTGDLSLQDTNRWQRQPEDEEPERVPETIGRYAIERVLGRGGFAVVYLARDTQLDRQVALKVPRQGRFNSDEELAQFVQEARNAAQLDHPGIVRVYDVQQERDVVYIVQQYVDGTDLATYAKSSQLSWERISELMIDIADAISHPHERRLYHRDLKPGNILVDSHGKPYVADFGLSVHASVQHEHRGERAGSCAYMSPEQVRGEAHRLDGRSDIWSLGVVLYELLVGDRPFHGETLPQLFDEIENRDPTPPSQIKPATPHELSRICLTCLAKRATDRYEGAAALVADLRHWLEGRTQAAPVPGGQVNQQVTEPPKAQTKIVPKGLRSFDASDSDFFLQLLPGPFDRDGLPKSIRFWKNRIEETDPDETFEVGLLYGPSGCGKSSLVKAGLLPRLNANILPVYIEATAGDTEVRILKGLRKHCPGLSDDLSLSEAFAQLRATGGPGGRKTLVVLDQFEQWLHNNEAESDSQLVRALRQCDGEHLQCLLMVRDDFWMSITRFMQSVEIPLLEGVNSAPVDLFDCDHARKVLNAFGRAFEKLDEELTDDETSFLDRAVTGLAQEDRLVCVRLAVFAEMMKGRPWTTESLRKVGGTEGIGVTFLEETFSARTAPPAHRIHQKAVQAVLRALLPDQGTDIKGRMQSFESLLGASGYAARRPDFDSLMRILDSELRLITPTEPDESTGSAETTAGTLYYQLTHDYLVPSLRDWLTRKQRETRRGRAELRLAERVALWNIKPENRHLPSLLEWLTIRMLTDRKQWTGPQGKMMSKAGRVHGLRWGTAILVILVIGITVQQIISSVQHRNLAERIQTAVAALSNSREILVPRAIEDLEEFPQNIVIEELRVQFADSDESQKLSLAYALAHFGDVGVDFLIEQIPTAASGEADNLVTSLGHSTGDALARLRESAASAEAKKNWRAKARLAIVALHLGDPSVAEDMCQLRPDPIQRTIFIDEFPTWHDPAALAALAKDIDDAAFRSGMCLAIGSIPVDQMTVDTKQSWQLIVSGWYQEKPDKGTHSAAGWALRQWKLDIPEIAGFKTPGEGMEWHVNSVGMTMLNIPAGSFAREDESQRTRTKQMVTLTRSFLLSDREVSRAQFQMFVDDADYPDSEKPKDWSGAHTLYSPRGEYPVQAVNWYDAVLFCNWLSHKEGLPVCYEHTGKKEEVMKAEYDEWRLVPNGLGFRLPTEAEWEFACRAGTVTGCAIGNDETLLVRYAVYIASRTEVCGSRLPNGWGLFDCHGNVAEWCQDVYASYGSEEAVSDPIGPTGVSRVLRGGSFNNGALFVRSASRYDYDPANRLYTYGFRPARTYPMSP